MTTYDVLRSDGTIVQIDAATFDADRVEVLSLPNSITRRQIITGLAKAEWITKQEAIDALSTGARPAAVEAVIATLPEEEQFDALTKWIGFTEAYRDDPLVLALAAAEGKSEAEIDDFFRMCAGIE